MLFSKAFAISIDDDFSMYSSYSYYAGDSIEDFFISSNIIRIKARSLGSRYNKYDQELYYSIKYENGIPFVYYTESNINYVSSDISIWGEEPFEIKKVEKSENKGILFINDYFFVLIGSDGSIIHYGSKYTYDTWEYHLSDTSCIESSFFSEESNKYSCKNTKFSFPFGKIIWGHPWVENVDGNGIGEWIEFIARSNNKYPHVFLRQKVYISIGYLDFNKPDLYLKNARPKTLSVYINDSYYCDVILEDTPNYQELIIGRLITEEDRVKIVIKDVYQGSLYNDTCINDIFILPVSSN